MWGDSMKSASVSLAVLLCLALCPPAFAQDARAADFWAACRNGDVAKVKEFLDAGMDPNTRFDTGITPLHAAAMRGQVEVAKLLVERGASLNLRDDSIGVTPLGIALFFGPPAVANYLLTQAQEDHDVLLLFGVFRNQQPWVEAALKSNLRPQDLTRALAVAKARPKPNADIVALLEKAGAQPPAALTPEQLSRFVGQYADATHMELEVVLRDGKLIGTGGSGFSEFFEQELVPLAPDLVFVSSSPTTIFQFEGAGKQFDLAKMSMPGVTFSLQRSGGRAQ